MEERIITLEECKDLYDEFCDFIHGSHNFDINILEKVRVEFYKLIELWETVNVELCQESIHLVFRTVNQIMR